MKMKGHSVQSIFLAAVLPLGLATAGCSKDNKGACCALDGACTMTTESACQDVFHGADSVCVGDRCPTGACCDGQTCEVILPERCEAPSNYGGDGTTCEPNPCAATTTGACCATDGTCSVTEQGSCTGTSTYEGDSTTCEPNPCTAQPTGACCDATNACTEETQADCGASGDRFLGAVATCDASTDPCASAGACCLAGGGCGYAADEQGCLATGGTFQGVGSACDGSCPPPSVEWADPGQGVNEDVGQVAIDAHLSGPWPTPITVPWTVGGTATNPADHDLGPGSLLFQAGSLTAGVTFNVVDDSDPEDAETVVATLSAPTDGSYALGAQTAHTVTIQDNDGAPTVQWAAATQNVPESVGQVTAVVQISAVQAVDVTVDYTVGGTATNPADHNAVNGQVVIPAGSTSANVQFNVVDDAAQEPDETVVLTITGVSGGGASAGTETVHTVTIQDDDGPTVEFAVTNWDVHENQGTDSAWCHISAQQSTDVTVDYTVGGTATNPADHDAASGSLVIPANTNGANLVYDIVNDLVQESDETVIFTLTAAHGAGAHLGANTVYTARIIDDDGPATFQPPHLPDGICRTHTIPSYVMWWSADTAYGWWDFAGGYDSSTSDVFAFMDGYVNHDDTAVTYNVVGSTMNAASLNPTNLQMGGSVGLFATGTTWGTVTGALQDLWTVAGGATVHVYRQYDMSQFPPISASEDSHSLPSGGLAQLIDWIPGVPGPVVLDPVNGTLYLLGDDGSLLDTQTGLGWLTRGEGAGSWFLGVTNDGDHAGGDPTLSNVLLYDGLGHTIANTWSNPNGTGDFRSASLDQDTTQLVGAAVAADGYYVIVVDIATGSSCGTWYSFGTPLLDVVVVYAQNALVVSTGAGNLEKWPLSPLLCTP